MKPPICKSELELRPAIATGHYPSSNTAAVVTLSAPTNGETHVILEIDASYDADPTGGRLTVVAGSTTILDLSFTKSGPGPLRFEHGLFRTSSGIPVPNEAVVVTLAAGGSGITGKLSVRYR